MPGGKAPDANSDAKFALLTSPEHAAVELLLQPSRGVGGVGPDPALVDLRGSAAG